MKSPRPSAAVILALAGVLMVASASSAAELFRAESVAVYDSTGKKVGTPSDGGVAQAQVVFRTGSGDLVFLTAYRSRLLGTATLAFRARNCEGPPLISSSATGGQPASYLRGPRQTLYVSAGAYSRQSVRSFYRWDDVCIDATDARDFAPASPAGIDFADYFTPPFALRATPGEPIPTGPVAEPLDRTDRVVVFDSTGKKVAPPDAYVAVTDSGITLPLSGAFSAYFQTTDCSGPLFVKGWGDVLVPAPLFVGPRETVYLPSEEPQWRKMYSQGSPANCHVLRGFHGGGHPWVGIDGYYAPTEPIGIDLADYFTRPFTLRAGKGIRQLPD